MKNLVRQVYLLVMIVWIVSTLPAIGQSFNFRTIRKEQGLLGGEIYKIIQDSKGYIWGVTDGGVFRYNGVSFQHFTEEDGLPGLTFFGLYEDYKGRIWISCSNGSIGYLQNEKYYAIAANDIIRKKLLYGQSLITDIYVDRGDTLWLGTTIRMFKVNPEKNFRYVSEIKPSIDENIRTLKIFDDKKVIGSSSYYTKPRPLGEDLNRVNYFSKILIEDLKSATPVVISWKIKFGTICNLTAAVLKDQTLLFSYGNKLYKAVDGVLKDSIEYDNRILRIVKDKSGDVWICLDKNGVVLLRQGSFKTVPAHFLTDVSVSDVVVDHEGSLWVSTLDRGMYFSPSLQIQYYGHLSGLNKKILALKQMNDGMLAINENGSGILVSEKGESREVFTVGSNITIGFYKAKPFRNGTCIVGLKTARLQNDYSMFDAVMDDGVNLYLQDMMEYEGDTNLMLSHSHLYVYNGIKHIRRFQLPGRGICFIKDDDNSVLVGLLGGLVRFSNGKFENITDFPGGSVRINQLYKDKSGRLWVCTKGKGLFYRDSGKWKSVTAKEGLVSNLCNVIIESEPGIFFTGTAAGLSRFKLDGDTVICNNYDATNGLSGNEVNALAYGNGWVWVGTSTGLNRVPAGGISPNLTPPPVYLRNILLNENHPVVYTSGMQFSHTENNLTFSIDMLSFKRQRGAQIHYTLQSDGFSLDRTIEGNSFELQNIPSGEYQLKIVGVNNFGIESLKPVILHFTVLPSFWRTWWFVLIVTASLAGSIALYLRWRLNIQFRKQEEQSGIERKLAEFRLEALRAQMNPHFVFNAINGIQRKILQQDPHEAYTYLTKFSQLIRLFLTSTNQQYIPISKELEALRLYVEFEQLRFDDSFDFELNVNREIEEENMQIPSMIIQPFVENAIWHGLMPLNNQRKGKVMVDIDQVDEHLRITISDNGIGLEKSSQQPRKSGHSSLGIELTRRRVELLTEQKGSIKVVKQTDGSEGVVVIIQI